VVLTVEDLFGRGFSDNPSPAHFRHSKHLYVAQILYALASSPTPGWIGRDNAFCLIGYSLGGGISSAFTDKFPRLVSSLVLMAPSGLIREGHVGWQSKVMYHTQGMLPEWLVKKLVTRRLDAGGTGILEEEVELVAEDSSIAAAVIIDNAGEASKKRLRIVDAACQWQLQNHPGFVDAFISAIRYAPITAQTATYARIGSRQTASTDSLCGGRVTLVLGANDPIIIAKEQIVDYKAALGERGEEILRVVLLEDVGHEVPVSVPELVAERLWEAWEEDGIPGVS
jgi:pimeloyl-ACP methyl ester carboxylesterase